MMTSGLSHGVEYLNGGLRRRLMADGLLANCSMSFANGSNWTVQRVWSAPNQLFSMTHHCCAGYTGCRLPDA